MIRIYTDCRVLFMIMLSVFILSVFILSVILLSVILLSVIILSVVVLSVVILSFIMLNGIYAECRGAVWDYIILRKCLLSDRLVYFLVWCHAREVSLPLGDVIFAWLVCTPNDVIFCLCLE